MTFDWTINVSQLLTVVAMVFVLLGAFYTMKSDVRALDARLILAEYGVRDQVHMNAKIIAEIAAVRQDVAVIRDRLEPPPISIAPYPPTKGS
jgi:hypothetical protein